MCFLWKTTHERYCTYSLVSTFYQGVELVDQGVELVGQGLGDMRIMVWIWSGSGLISVFSWICTSRRFLVDFINDLGRI